MAEKSMYPRSPPQFTYPPKFDRIAFMPQYAPAAAAASIFNRWALLLWALLITLAPQTEANEVAQYHSRNWQRDSGLPNNIVQAVVQTRNGYLWIGTQYGLARFDGVRFMIFDPDNVPAMKNANILGLHESSDGSLWIATGTGGVLKLKDGKFAHFGKTDGL